MKNTHRLRSIVITVGIAILFFVIGSTLAPQIGKIAQTIKGLFEDKPTFTQVEEKYLTKQTDQDSVGIYLNPSKFDIKVEEGLTYKQKVEVGNSGMHDAYYTIKTKEDAAFKIKMDKINIPSGMKKEVELEITAPFEAKEKKINESFNLIAENEGKGEREGQGSATISIPIEMNATIIDAPIYQKTYNYMISNPVYSLLGIVFIISIAFVLNIVRKKKNIKLKEETN